MANPSSPLTARAFLKKKSTKKSSAGEIDFAVHSLKDVPIVEQQTGTVLAAIPKRDSPCDVFISKNKVRSINLPKGALSERAAFADSPKSSIFAQTLTVEPIRGNVDTRIGKVCKGEFAGIVIAEAGLERMDMTERNHRTPAPRPVPIRSGTGRNRNCSQRRQHRRNQDSAVHRG